MIYLAPAGRGEFSLSRAVYNWTFAPARSVTTRDCRFLIGAHTPSCTFPAADEEQFEFIKRVIDDCDYYLVILGGRYGSLTPEGISYTEKEYDYVGRQRAQGSCAAPRES